MSRVSTVTIRRERVDDVASIRHVIEHAFDTTAEANLVERLRAGDKAVVSLAAERAGQVVGHILFSPVSVTHAPQTFRAVGLAPLSVLPEFQQTGIGSALVRDGLAACQEAGCDAVVVLGHVDYYRRFGFSRASDVGLDNEYGATDAFMVMELRSGALQGVGGLVRYAEEFASGF